MARADFIEFFGLAQVFRCFICARVSVVSTRYGLFCSVVMLLLS